MYIFKITKYSKCESYFNAYLKSVTVIAENEQQALKYAQELTKSIGEDFIKPVTLENVELLGPCTPGVIDYDISSDY